MTDSLEKTTEQDDKIFSDSTSVKDVSDQSVEILPNGYNKKMTMRSRSIGKRSTMYDRGNEKKSAMQDGGTRKRIVIQDRPNENKLAIQNGGSVKTLPMKYGANAEKSDMQDRGIRKISDTGDGGNVEKTATQELKHTKISIMQNGGVAKISTIQNCGNENVANMNNVDPQTSVYNHSTINTADDIQNNVLFDENPERESSIGLKVQKNLEIPGKHFISALFSQSHMAHMHV